ncbi:MAG TPA: DUF4097 family beta strand repeat-containing protein [Gemmatimonadales bacterium]
MSLPFSQLLLAAALGAAAAAPAAAQVTRHNLGGDSVAIYNLAGTVRLDPGSGSAVVAEVTPRGDDGARLRVETGMVRGRDALRVVYPGLDIVYPGLGRGHRTQFTIYEDGTFFGDHGRRERGREVRVTSDGDGLEAHADLRILVPPGKSVAVFVGVGSVHATNVNGNLLIDVAAADVTTSGTRGALYLDLGSGEVAVRDAEGEVTVDAGSGDISLTNIRGREILLDTGSGTITGSGIRATTLRLDTGSGDVRLDGVTAPTIDLDTGSGSVTLGLDADIERLSLDSGSGDVTIHAPASLGARIEAETASGNVGGSLISSLTRRSSDDDEDDDRHVSGVIGDGDGMITIDSGSGDVRLERR